MCKIQIQQPTPMLRRLRDMARARAQRAQSSSNAQEDRDIFRSAVLCAYWAHQDAHNCVDIGTNISAVANANANTKAAASSTAAWRSDREGLYSPVAHWKRGERLLYAGQMDNVSLFEKNRRQTQRSRTGRGKEEHAVTMEETGSDHNVADADNGNAVNAMMDSSVIAGREETIDDTFADFDKEAAGATLIQMSAAERRQLVHDVVSMQVNRLFELAYAQGWPAGHRTPYPPPHSVLRQRAAELERERASNAKRALDLGDSVGQQGTTSTEQSSRAHLDDAVQKLSQYEQQQQQPTGASAIPHDLFQPGLALPHTGGFVLQTRKSRIDHEDSGYGLFVRGTVCPGTVVALYPGTVYFYRQLTEAVTRGNEYMISRFDGAVIDGRDWGVQAGDQLQAARALRMSGADVSLDDTEKRDETGDDMARFKNPFALGSYVNHPPKGAQPNVMAIAYDFPEFEDDPRTLPHHLRSLIPNKDVAASLLHRQHNCLQRSVALIAIRPIVDEELLLNYRFNPAHPYPSWYSQPDEEEAQRRWARPRLLFGGFRK